MAMTAARCAECQAIIDAEQAAGRVYSAWQQADTPWHVSFIGPPETRRATGLTVHDAIQALGATFQAAIEGRGVECDAELP